MGAVLHICAYRGAGDDGDAILGFLATHYVRLSDVVPVDSN